MGERLRTPELYSALDALAQRDGDYAIAGPAGLYLRLLPLVEREQQVFSDISRIYVVGNVSGIPFVENAGLQDFRSGFERYASRMNFDGRLVKVAAPPYLTLDYLLNGRDVSDLCSFVKAGGDIEPESVRNLLKAAKCPERFSEVLEILYDFQRS